MAKELEDAPKPGRVIAENIYECWESCQGDLHAEWTCPLCGEENLHVLWAEGDEVDECKECGAKFEIVREG